MKKTQIKVTVPVRMAQDLDNVSTLSGNTVQSVIRQYLAGYLYCPQPGPPGVPPPRAHESKGSLKKKKKIGETTLREESASEHPAKATALPPDFDPPESITKRARLHRRGAIDAFTNWAIKNERKAVNWDIEFAGACNWIRERYPQLHREPMNRRDTSK